MEIFLCVIFAWNAVSLKKDRYLKTKCMPYTRLFLPEIHPSPLEQNAVEMSFGLLEMSFGISEMSFAILKLEFLHFGPFSWEICGEELRDSIQRSFPNDDLKLAPLVQ